MNPISNSAKRVNDFNVENFSIRLRAKLCIFSICIFTLIPRFMVVIKNPSLPTKPLLLIAVSIPFPILMGLVIALEYFFYRKRGPGFVMKYSNLVDIMLLLLFTADWMLVLASSLLDVEQTIPVSWKITTVYGFTTFSWRTLAVALIVRKWQLKIIPPFLAVSMSAIFVQHYLPAAVVYTVTSAASQLLNIFLIIYSENKVNWQLMWANIQKDRWMQMNDSILNNIPENIILLDLEGKAKFVSEYCKSFMERCGLAAVDTKDFFKKIQDLKQQQQQTSENERQNPSILLQIERLTSVDMLPPDINKDTLEEVVTSFKEIIKNKEIQERQCLVYNGKLKLESQKEKSLEIKISYIQHFEDSYISLILRDTTQRDFLLTSEETNKCKDQLLASVSHDLRAPLNENINIIESAVQSKKIPESVKETLLIPVLRSSKFLLYRINDILDMSQIKEKKLRLVFQSENLRDTIKSTAKLVELQAKKKGIELCLEIDSQISQNFCTDHMRLSQVILNLLNNAIKFTKEGTIKLFADSVPKSTSVRITVEDSGIGMSPENIQKLLSSSTHTEFEDRQDENSTTGVSLGLDIAYNLAVLLGPEGYRGLEVTSIPGQGSAFTFILENKEKEMIKAENLKENDESSELVHDLPRLAKLKPSLKLQRNLSNTSSIPLLMERTESHCSINISCACPKIMVVDDNPFNTMAFETILSSMEVKCDLVYSGSACIKNLLNRQTKPCSENCEQYALIFVDQEMEEMSGSDTVHEIKRLQEENLLSKSIQVIGCTAHKSREEEKQFMEAGINQCIQKPISASIVQKILKERNISDS